MGRYFPGTSYTDHFDFTCADDGTGKNQQTVAENGHRKQ